MTQSVFNLDQTKLDEELKTFGKQGGKISLEDFRNLTNMGHRSDHLTEAVQNATSSGLTIGSQLQSYLDTGQTPDLPGLPGIPDLRGTPFQNTFAGMTDTAETNFIVRDPDTGGVLGYTEDSGVLPLPGQTVNIYDKTKSRIIGTLTGGEGGADPVFNEPGVGGGGGADGGVNTETDQQEDDRFDPVAFMNAFSASQQATLETITGQMAKERADSEKRFAQLTESFQKQMRQKAANMRERPQVEGIRFATRGTGGATQQQLRRRGVSGTFGRSGDRLMKISSLNI